MVITAEDAGAIAEWKKYGKLNSYNSKIETLNISAGMLFIKAAGFVFS